MHAQIHGQMLELHQGDITLQQHYPMDQAARIAMATAIDFLQQHGRPELIRFVLFDAGAYGAFAAALEELAPTGEGREEKGGDEAGIPTVLGIFDSLPHAGECYDSLAN